MHSADRFQDWNKVDLHRHLEGSLRLSTLRELAQHTGLLGEKDARDLQDLVTVSAADPHTPDFFFSRFPTIRKFFLDRAVIERLVEEVIADAAADHVRYLELRFTPAALASQRHFALEQVSDWVISAANAAAESHALQVRFLLSFNRHEPTAVAEQVAAAALAFRSQGVVGLDLAGDEVHHRLDPFKALLMNARQEGLKISVHAGEWGSVDELRTAIRDLGASRIGHGVRILEDPDLVREAREADVCFEISLTSNLRTGSIPALVTHPLPAMLEAGLRVALTTDDPAIFGITLSDEYSVAHEMLSLSSETLKGMTLSAVQASFLDAKLKRQLEAQFVNEFWGEGSSQ